MTTNNAALIPWSSIMDLWETEDPEALDNFHSYYQGADLSPYERLIEIHKVVEDTNEEFFDSLVESIRITANAEDKEFEIDDICEEGVYVNLN